MQIRLQRNVWTAIVAIAARSHATSLKIRRAAKSHFRLGAHATYALLSLLLLLFFNGGSIPLSSPALCHAIDYSYSSFAGPVVGPEHKVYVYDARSGNTNVDYVAKPAYAFAYGVEDTESRVSHNREEMRDGDAVQGVYRVVEPDGSLRVVKYVADNINGFQAKVIRNGAPINHGHYQHVKDYGTHPSQLPPIASGQPNQQGHYEHNAASAEANNNSGDNNADDDYEEIGIGYEVQEQHDKSSEYEDDGTDETDEDDDSHEDYEEATQEAQSYEKMLKVEDYY